MKPSAAPLKGKLGVAATVEFLERDDWHYDLIEHEPTYRAVDEAEVSGMPPHHEAKTVALRGRSGFVLVTVPASDRVDLHKVRELWGDHSLHLASEEEIGRAFPRFQIGALPPLGKLVGAPQVVDRKLLDCSHIASSAGDHAHSLVMVPAELVHRLEPTVADVCED